MYDIEILIKGIWRYWASFKSMRSANKEAMRLEKDRGWHTRIVHKKVTAV